MVFLEDISFSFGSVYVTSLEDACFLENMFCAAGSVYVIFLEDPSCVVDCVCCCCCCCCCLFERFVRGFSVANLTTISFRRNVVSVDALV